MSQITEADRATLQAILMPTDPNSPSTIYSMLPIVVRNRIPRLTSIRRKSLEMMRAAGQRSRPSSQEFDTPPALDNLDDVNVDVQLQVEGKSAEMSRSSSSDSEGLMTTVDPGQAIRTRLANVNWDAAAAGIQLWLTARQQLSRSNADPLVLRAMFIDATKYMQMALPTDLTPNEIAAIQSSLPEQLRLPNQAMAGEDQPQKLGGNRLQEGVSQMTCSVIALLLFFMPFLLALYRTAQRFERENQITEKVFAGSLNVMDILGDRALIMKNEFVRFSHGRVGSSLASLVIWIVETGIWTFASVISGVNDGLVKSTSGRVPIMEQS